MFFCFLSIDLCKQSEKTEQWPNVVSVVWILKNVTVVNVICQGRQTQKNTIKPRGYLVVSRNRRMKRIKLMMVMRAGDFTEKFLGFPFTLKGMLFIGCLKNVEWGYLVLWKRRLIRGYFYIDTWEFRLIKEFKSKGGTNSKNFEYGYLNFWGKQ